MQLFGDNNTLVRYAHSYVIITKKLHSIPYDTVTHSNEVINPSVLTRVESDNKKYLLAKESCQTPIYLRGASLFAEFVGP